MAFYGADAVFMEPNAPPKSGEALRTSWEDLFKMKNVSLTWTVGAVQVSDDATMAYDMGSYQFGFDDAEHGRIEDHGKYLVVWRKQGADWKAVADTYSSDVPLPQPGAEQQPAEAEKPQT